MEKRPLFHVAGAVCAACWLFATVADASAETCKLELKRLASQTSRGYVVGPQSDYVYRYSYPQSFYKQVGRGIVLDRSEEAEFSKTIKKEPAEYVSKDPFRGVAELGTEKYGFVLDARPPEPEETTSAEPDTAKSNSKANRADTEPSTGAEKLKPPQQTVESYCRLYFDLNNNGDLTDDEVIEAERDLRFSSGSYVRCNFPPVELTIDLGGKKLDYAFFFNIYSSGSGDYRYASASLNAAVYREGTITLDGKRRQVALIDFNSNGRFDDRQAIREDVTISGGGVYASYGDMLLVDPSTSGSNSGSPYDPTTSDYRNYLAKIVNIDGRFYDVRVSAAGDELTLEPTRTPLGNITNPNDGYCAVLYGEQGFVKVSGGKSEPVSFPEGDWKLYNYTINQTGWHPEALTATKPAAGREEKTADKEQATSLLQVLADTLTEGAKSLAPAVVSRPSTTLVSARGSKDYEVVKVRKGTTVTLPFGPPYKPVVSVGYRSGTDKVSLGMSLIGSAGESCSNLMVGGGRPDKPTFTISTPDGKEMASGSFEYG